MAQFEWCKLNNTEKPHSQTDHVPLCSITDVQLRFLCPNDLEEVMTLCQDWFPIDYPLTWYEDITSSSRFFALAAVYNLAIIGLIVAEIKPYSKLNKEDKGILPESMGRAAEVGYILSLGVHRKHRRNGIGSLLLESLVNHLTTAERHSVKAIFLHVLTTNQQAILFYEKRSFHLHSFLPYYYHIAGKDKDGFTYVSYINGGHRPWTLYPFQNELIMNFFFLSLQFRISFCFANKFLTTLYRSFKILGIKNFTSWWNMFLDRQKNKPNFSVAVA